MKKPYVKKPVDPNAPSVWDTHKDLVAQRFIEGAQSGNLPMAQLLNASEVPDFPHNPVTGKTYSKVNAAHLNSEQMLLRLMSGPDFDGGDNQWSTYAQWQSVGGQVRKGETGVRVITKIPLSNPQKEKAQQPNEKPEATSESKGEQKQRPDRWRVKTYTVFHASQVDGLPPRQKRLERPMDERVQAVLDVVKESGAEVQYGGRQPGYNPFFDVIMMPERSTFKDDLTFAGVLLHELGHWTGGKGRRDRGMAQAVGDEQALAREELVATTFSFMAAQRLGISFQPHLDHEVSYAAQWAALVKNDPGEFTKAVSEAAAICDDLNLPMPTYEILQSLEKPKPEQTRQAKTGPMANPAAKGMKNAPPLALKQRSIEGADPNRDFGR